MRTPCELLAYPQGYAYPRLRIAVLDHLINIFPTYCIIISENELQCYYPRVPKTRTKSIIQLAERNWHFLDQVPIRRRNLIKKKKVFFTFLKGERGSLRDLQRYHRALPQQQQQQNQQQQPLVITEETLTPEEEDVVMVIEPQNVIKYIHLTIYIIPKSINFIKYLQLTISISFI